jgi:hypothetical protein
MKPINELKYSILAQRVAAVHNRDVSLGECKLNPHQKTI